MPVGRSYIQATVRRAGITAQDLRADRVLGEAHATGGDPLRLTRLFGISDPTAIRYCAETGQLDQAIGQMVRDDNGRPTSWTSQSPARSRQSACTRLPRSTGQATI